jgi:uncharacterized protein (TIGR00369 family)
MRHPLNTPIGRFGLTTDEQSVDRCVATMPVHGLVSPISDAPTLGPLAVLVDHVAGLVNHHRRAANEWTVSSELSLELTPASASVVAAHGDVPVVGTARPVGAKHATSLAECQLTVGDHLIGTGTVRSFYIEAPDQYSEFPDAEGDMEPKFGFAAMMATGDPLRDGDAHVLPQLSDPVLNNSIDVVHGGIASAGLEVVASAAVNAGRDDDPLTTASLRVNFLRQFFAGGQSRYVGTALRTGRRSGVAESQAIGADGKVAIIARMTAYRC